MISTWAFIAATTCCVLGSNALAIDKPSYLNIVPKDQRGNISSRIVGGIEAPIGLFPYQVSIRKDNRHSCGGSIINKRWILTAAHCLEYLAPDELTIVAGTNTLDTGGKTFQSVRIIRHSEYRPIANDIGVIMVNETIEYSKYIQPIELASIDVDINDYPAVISGWGRVGSNAEVPNNLQYLPTRLLSQKICKKSNPEVGKQLICSFSQRGQGNCFGDSGSPLVSDGVQVGIASYIKVGCAYGYPDVYTRVTAHLDWIKENAKLN